MADRHDRIYRGAVITLHLGESQVDVTTHHPFWVVEGARLEERAEVHPGDTCSTLNGRWVHSHELQAGDRLTGVDGTILTLERIEQRFEESFLVSNLSIVDHHNYAVGEIGILVHNESWCTYLSKTLKVVKNETLDNPHAHHIVMKTVTGGSRGPHIQAAQDILKKCEIDVMYGKSNLAWARNWDHSEAYCEAVATTLKEAYGRGGEKGKKRVAKALEGIAAILGEGKKFRSLTDMQKNIDATNGLIP